MTELPVLNIIASHLQLTPPDRARSWLIIVSRAFKCISRNNRTGLAYDVTSSGINICKLWTSMNLHLFNAMLLVMAIGIFAKFAILIKKERNKKILEKINLWIDEIVGCRYRDSCETASVFRISVTPFSRSRKKSVPRSNIILCKKNDENLSREKRQRFRKMSLVIAITVRVKSE